MERPKLKRTLSRKMSRIGFVGVSNLPSQKAQDLGNSLQLIVTAAADVHKAVDDERMSIDERCKRIESLAGLGGVVTKVASLICEEAMMCTVPTVREELVRVSDGITRQATALQNDLSAYSNDHPQRGALAKIMFEQLLRFAQESIEFLKTSDRGTVSKLASHVTNARAAAQGVIAARSLDELANAGKFLEEVNTTVAKRFKYRAEVFDDAEITKTVEATTAKLQQSIGIFLHMFYIVGNNIFFLFLRSSSVSKESSVEFS